MRKPGYCASYWETKMQTGQLGQLIQTKHMLSSEEVDAVLFHHLAGASYSLEFNTTINTNKCYMTHKVLGYESLQGTKQSFVAADIWHTAQTPDDHYTSMRRNDVHFHSLTSQKVLNGHSHKNTTCKRIHSDIKRTQATQANHLW